MVGERPVAPFSVLVLGEDTAKDAHQTLVAIAASMMSLIVPGCEPSRGRFEPPEDGPVRQALRGNLWESTRPQDQEKRRSLIRYVATKLLEGPTSFVIWHMDADRPWRQRPKCPKELERLTKFRKFVERDVQQFIEHRAQQMKAASVPQISLSQLLLLVPYYSIEAWLFQNTIKARQLCSAHPTCLGQHTDLLSKWESDRRLLDEITKPKDALCFGSQHNRSLAEYGFPVTEVNAADKSYAETVGRLRASASLCRVLEGTRIV